MRLRVVILSMFLIAGVLSLSACADAKVKHYKAKAVAEYPHDTQAYTQGLFIHSGQLYETTGLHGESSLRKVELESGAVTQRVNIANKYFVEGSVILSDRMYVLTWSNKVAFIYNPSNLEYISTYSYPREGWGLTTDGRHLIASDGSSSLYFMKENFAVVKRLNVNMDGRPVRMLNELEYIDGKIWANVYMTDLIVIVNPETGKVEATIDASELLPDALRTPQTDVLNGIAYDKEGGRIYLTGKNWPKIYQVELKEIK